MFGIVEYIEPFLVKPEKNEIFQQQKMMINQNKTNKQKTEQTNWCPL